MSALATACCVGFVLQPPSWSKNAWVEGALRSNCECPRPREREDAFARCAAELTARRDFGSRHAPCRQELRVGRAHWLSLLQDEHVPLPLFSTVLSTMHTPWLVRVSRAFSSPFRASLVAFAHSAPSACFPCALVQVLADILRLGALLSWRLSLARVLGCFDYPVALRACPCARVWRTAAFIARQCWNPRGMDAINL